MLFVVSLARRKPARRIILSACGALSLIAVFAFAAPPAPPPVRTVGNLVLDGVPDIPDALAERMQQYQNVRAAGLLDWDPNGQGVLISTRFGETNQLHFVQKPGGARTQLTFFPEPVRSAQWRPRVGDREARGAGILVGPVAAVASAYFFVGGQRGIAVAGARRRGVGGWRGGIGGR